MTDQGDINLRIGARLRKLRGDRELTLEALADRTGVSVSMLSAIERGRKSPTLTVLNKIKSGLGISLSELIDDTCDDDRRIIRREDMRLLHHKMGCELRMMLDCVTSERFEVMRQVLAPHSRWESERHFGGNLWEYCLVVQGTLKMQLEEDLYTVEEGEIFSFMTDVSHTYINEGDGELALIVINAYR